MKNEYTREIITEIERWDANHWTLDGSFETCPYFTEILKLQKLLDAADIPYEMKKKFGGYIIIYNDENGRYIGDAVQHCGSYGRCENLLEIMGFGINIEDDGDEVKGWLTAGQVFYYFERAFRGDEVIHINW